MKYIYVFVYLLGMLQIFTSCQNKHKEIIYDDTACHYKSYDGIVMAGYQGWFTTEDDGAERGWHHYEKKGFLPGQSSVDFWPDVSEYEKTYKTLFQYPNGDCAYLYSPIDESSVDLHFKWMRDYGIDGVFMQRFIIEIKNPKGKAHFNKVFENALKAAKKYDRAICVMYDLNVSDASAGDLDLMVKDWEELQRAYNLFDNKQNPTYLWHNGRPMVAIWGIGFRDDRNKYTTEDITDVVEKIKGPEKRCSVMLGVPYYWRTGVRDTESGKAHSDLLSLIKKCDFIMPWAVGRYDEATYDSIAISQIKEDLKWCNENNIDYAPLCYPGFSWANMQPVLQPENYDQIPRNGGKFLWKQMCGAKIAGANALYLAMFDEVDEGTALFKCLRMSEVPLNGELPSRFIGIEDNLPTDHYLWLAGQGRKLIRNEIPITVDLPMRTN